MKRTFLLFGCIYEATMIDKEYGNTSICFELSIGSSGYLNPQQMIEATRVPVTSLTRSYPSVPVDNNKQYFRLPIDLQKPILFTKYTFHDYVFRMTLSNRFKNAAEHIVIRFFILFSYYFSFLSKNKFVISNVKSIRKFPLKLSWKNIRKFTIISIHCHVDVLNE